ncbi:MAG: hypothetical protein ACRCS5_00355 [Sphingomonas sp.]|uniref:hypothetical protein n=1 Tax=Sphingomonas sp. TaxID=28214 RepID=UPI0030F9EE4A
MIALATAAVITSSAQQICPLPFEVAQTESAARAIAEIVIKQDPSRSNNHAVDHLTIYWVEERRSWIINQSIQRDGVRFGGGLSMEIAACDGRVSDLDHPR